MSNDDCLFNIEEFISENPIEKNILKPKKRMILDENYMSPFTPVIEAYAEIQEESRAKWQRENFEDEYITDQSMQALFTAVIVRAIKDSVCLDLRLGNGQDEDSFEHPSSIQKRAIDWFFNKSYDEDFRIVCELANRKAFDVRKKIKKFLQYNNIIDINCNLIENNAGVSVGKINTPDSNIDILELFK